MSTVEKSKGFEGVKLEEAGDNEVEKEAEDIARIFNTAYEAYPFDAWTNPGMLKDTLEGGDEVLVFKVDDPGKAISGALDKVLEEEKVEELTEDLTNQRIEEAVQKLVEETEPEDVDEKLVRDIDEYKPDSEEDDARAGHRRAVEDVASYLSKLEEGNVIGTSSLKFQENGQVIEFGSSAVHPVFWGKNVFKTLNGERVERSRDYSGIVYGQAVSSEHAATQGRHFDRGLFTVGLSRNKYPEMNPGLGRETVVQLVDSNGDFQFVEERLEKDRPVYVTSYTEDLVEYAVEGINRLREKKSELARETKEETDTDLSDFSYSLKKKADLDNHGLVSYQLMPGGEMTIDEARRELVEKKQDDRYSWVGVELDANHVITSKLTNNLIENSGFLPEKYFPEKLNPDSLDYQVQAPRDVIGLQYSEEETGEIELIEEAVDVGEIAGLMDREEDTDPNTGYENTYNVEIPELEAPLTQQI